MPIKQPKECKDIEELMDVEVNARTKLIVLMTKLGVQLSVLQRTMELFANNPTRELFDEIKAQYLAYQNEFREKELDIDDFFKILASIVEMRPALTPKMYIPGISDQYRGITRSGNPGELHIP
jgi:hypothetical protein